MTERQRRVIAMLKERSSASWADMIHACGCSVPDAELVLGIMHRGGQIIRLESGRFTLNPDRYLDADDGA